MDKKKYTFVRIREKGDDVGNGYWYLKADSEDAIREHWLKYCKDDMQLGVRELFDIRCCKVPKHFTSHFGSLVDLNLQCKGGHPVTKALELENELYRQRIGYFHDGCEQYLTKSLTVFMVDERFHEIVETVESDQLVYPDEIKLSLDQVKYSRWEGFYGKRGVHWYAKVGRLDVVDEQGNVKWNTKEEAEEAARKFIEKHNDECFGKEETE